MRIDLDAARAARREARGEGPIVVIDGKELELPAELPFEVAESLSGLSEESIRTDPGATAGAVQKVLGALLGDAREEFMASHPSLDDVLELLDGLMRSYGVADLPESVASVGS